MKLLPIISIGATILALSHCTEGKKLRSIESSMKTINSLEIRQGTFVSVNSKAQKNIHALNRNIESGEST